MTEQLDIRPASLADIHQLTDIYNHYVEHTAITFDLAPWSVKDRTLWFHFLWSKISLESSFAQKCYIITDLNFFFGAFRTWNHKDKKTHKLLH